MTILHRVPGYTGWSCSRKFRASRSAPSFGMGNWTSLLMEIYNLLERLLKNNEECLLKVHKNIAMFGGDSSRVTFFGSSAGAASVALHMLTETSGCGYTWSYT